MRVLTSANATSHVILLFQGGDFRAEISSRSQEPNITATGIDSEGLDLRRGANADLGSVLGEVIDQGFRDRSARRDPSLGDLRETLNLADTYDNGGGCARDESGDLKDRSNGRELHDSCS